MPRLDWRSSSFSSFPILARIVSTPNYYLLCPLPVMPEDFSRADLVRSSKISLVSLTHWEEKTGVRREEKWRYPIAYLQPVFQHFLCRRSERKTLVSSLLFFSKQKKKEYWEYLAKFRHDETNTKSIFQQELNAFVAWRHRPSVSLCKGVAGHRVGGQWIPT